MADESADSSAPSADQIPGVVSRPFSGQSVLPDFSGRRLQVKERLVNSLINVPYYIA